MESTKQSKHWCVCLFPLVTSNGFVCQKATVVIGLNWSVPRCSISKFIRGRALKKESTSLQPPLTQVTKSSYLGPIVSSLPLESVLLHSPTPSSLMDTKRGNRRKWRVKTKCATLTRLLGKVVTLVTVESPRCTQWTHTYTHTPHTQ